MPAALEQRLAAQAYALGFDLVGFARLGVPDSLTHYEAWLDNGRHASLGYMERSRALRADSTRPEPGMVSAIVVGMNYGGTQPSGPIARYARGSDYHRVLWDKLDALGDALRIESGTTARTRGVVDSAPFLERDLARRAGLGWFGKNTMLISPTLGSFFVLGALLTDLELAPSEPFDADRCGSCTRCIDACPTDAIVEPRVLDARECISYHTIESREAIPPHIATAMGGLIFGCDICQEVCPWNVKFARELAEGSPFAARPFLDGKDAMTLARDILALDQEQFSTAFRKSPMKRAKLAGLKRNATVVLGNMATSCDPSAP
jgi:epoxyqueuosine reductase